jgi:hypothetical protein
VEVILKRIWFMKKENEQIFIKFLISLCAFSVTIKVSDVMTNISVAFPQISKPQKFVYFVKPKHCLGKTVFDSEFNEKGVKIFK